MQSERDHDIWRCLSDAIAALEEAHMYAKTKERGMTEQEKIQWIVNLTENIMECNGYREGAIGWLGPRLHHILELAKSLRQDES